MHSKAQHKRRYQPWESLSNHLRFINCPQFLESMLAMEIQAWFIYHSLLVPLLTERKDSAAGNYVLALVLPLKENIWLNLLHGKITNLSSFLHPWNRNKSEEVMRYSVRNSHAWTSQSLPIPFCPALQAVFGSFLFPNQCQGARHEHRMQILLHPGSMWNNLDSYLNSTLPCFLKQAETRVTKCTLNESVQWTSYVNPLMFEKGSTSLRKKKLQWNFTAPCGSIVDLRRW